MVKALVVVGASAVPAGVVEDSRVVEVEVAAEAVAGAGNAWAGALERGS